MANHNEIIEAHYKTEADLDRLFAEVGEGFRMVVRRSEPSWCDGHLETVELDPAEPLNMDQLRERYGGRKLQIKILNQKGDYVANRTVKFPDPPKHDGAILIQGQQQTAPDNSGTMRDLFEIMIQGQRETANAMIGMLTNRVQGLEQALQAAQDRALGIVPAVTTGPSGGFEGIKESIRAIQEIEKFKAAMIGASGTVEPTVMETGIEKLMDLMLKKEELKMSQAMAAQVAGQQSVPALGPASTYSPPLTDKITALNATSDAELAAYIKQRLAGMDERERMALISEVADCDFVEEDEKTKINGQTEPIADNESSGLPSVELTAEDAERLDGGANATPGSQTRAV